MIISLESFATASLTKFVSGAGVGNNVGWRHWSYCVAVLNPRQTIINELLQYIATQSSDVIVDRAP